MIPVRRLSACVILLAAAGCAGLSGQRHASRADVEASLTRAESFFALPYNGRVNPDDLWLFHLAALKRPELAASPLYAVDPFSRFANHPALRLIDRSWTPAGFDIRPATPDHPSRLANGRYHLPPPFDREVYMPRDEALLRALYCATSGYNEHDLDILLGTVTGDGGYNDTHALVALLILQQSDCLPEPALNPHIQTLLDSIIAAQENDPPFNDLYVERVAFLYWAGAGRKVRREWIDTIVERQLTGGAWEADGSPGVNLHQTALAVLALAYHLDGAAAQPFFGLGPAAP